VSRAHDVIVAGVGAMGAAACAALARRGMRVLGLDASSIPNGHSSHTGQTRVFRVAYAEHPDYVPLLRRAQAAWVELGHDVGEHLYRECAVLYVGPGDGALVTGVAGAAGAHGVPLERLEREPLRTRFPQFRVPEGWTGLLEPRAGWVAAEAGVAALATAALRAGAELHGSEPVLSWEERSGGVVVRTSEGEHHAGRLVVTSGAWSGRLLAGLGVGLRVTRQVLVWVWPREPGRFTPDRFPVWAIETRDGLAYGFPLAPGLVGIKLAMHVAGEVVDPDAPPRTLRESDREPLMRVLHEFIPPGVGPVVAHAVCLYTGSPDGHFIIDRLPGSERVVFGAGFSGHGFKFAPVVGEALADLALEGRSTLPVNFLSLRRFEGRQAP